jgi:hypothetical protein
VQEGPQITWDTESRGIDQRVDQPDKGVRILLNQGAVFVLQPEQMHSAGKPDNSIFFNVVRSEGGEDLSNLNALAEPIIP